LYNLNKSMKSIFIIPARSGSKGIPNKNIKTLNGLPMFVWSIIHAKYIAKNNDVVCVSSDSQDYLQIANEWGAETRLRPSNLARDESPTEPVMKDVIKQYDLDGDDNVILLQPSSPLRTKKSLKKLSQMIREGEKSIVSVKEAYEFEWEAVNQDYFSPKYTGRPRRQDMQPRYIENGSIYLTKINIFKKFNNRISELSKLIIMNEIESIDVDNLDELNLANQLGLEFNLQWKKQQTN
jgi:CMP-N,N'-diacetyllegionaminic acid synthase